MAGIATQDHQHAVRRTAARRAYSLFRVRRAYLHQSDRMTNPTTEEIVKVAQSGNTGEVKTLTDIKLEAFEKRLTEMEKVNAELRAANAELYAYASALSQPQAQAQPAQPQAPAQPVAAAAVQPSQDQAAVEAARQREEENLNSVLATMGYRKAQNTATPPNDGM